MAAMPQESAADEGPKRDTVIGTYVALVLFLFAFFVVLNGRGRLEPRKWQATAESLRQSFGAHLPDATGLPVDARTLQASVHLARLGVDLTRIAGVKPETVTTRGNSMEIAIPTERLFSSGVPELRSADTPLLDRLVASLSTPPRGSRLDLQIVMPETASDAEGDTSLLRGAELAQSLMSRGAPPQALTVTFGRGDMNVVMLRLKVSAADSSSSAARGGSESERSSSKASQLRP